MLTKNSRNNTDKEINKNVYYLDNKEVKTDHIEFYAVIMYTDNEDNTYSFNQFL